MYWPTRWVKLHIGGPRQGLDMPSMMLWRVYCSSLPPGVHRPGTTMLSFFDGSIFHITNTPWRPVDVPALIQGSQSVVHLRTWSAYAFILWRLGGRASQRSADAPCISIAICKSIAHGVRPWAHMKDRLWHDPSCISVLCQHLQHVSSLVGAFPMGCKQFSCRTTQCQSTHNSECGRGAANQANITVGFMSCYTNMKVVSVTREESDRDSETVAYPFWVDRMWSWAIHLKDKGITEHVPMSLSQIPSDTYEYLWFP